MGVNPCASIGYCISRLAEADSLCAYRVLVARSVCIFIGGARASDALGISINWHRSCESSCVMHFMMSSGSSVAILCKLDSVVDFIDRLDDLMRGISNCRLTRMRFRTRGDGMTSGVGHGGVLHDVQTTKNSSS